MGVAIVADGMGGYNAGEVASGMATTLLGEALQRLFAERTAGGSGANGRVWAHDALDQRDCPRSTSIIYETALTQPQCAGMGTTLVMALFHDDHVTVAHLGDSRLYRLRGDELQQITRDHSLLQEQIDGGMLTRGGGTLVAEQESGDAGARCRSGRRTGDSTTMMCGLAISFCCVRTASPTWSRTRLIAMTLCLVVADPGSMRQPSGRDGQRQRRARQYFGDSGQGPAGISRFGAVGGRGSLAWFR